MRRRKGMALHRRYGRSQGDGYKRVGVAFTKPRGPTQRRDEYGIYESSGMAYGVPVPKSLYTQYEGYREQRAGGEAQVGTALGGRGWSPPIKTEFVPSHFAEIRFFDGRTL